MKANKVSALRSKRGLHRVNGAEPQVVGLTPQTTDERKTDTMKTYILRRVSSPVRAAKINSLAPPKNCCSRGDHRYDPRATDYARVKGQVLFIGLDVHNDSIAVSLAPSDGDRSATLRDHWRGA